MPNRSRILVVDDDAVIRDLISELLGSDGHHVSQAAGGAEALDLLAKQRFDLVLCDLKMPVKDGIELGGLDFLRLASGIAPGLLTVMMTGFGTIETAVSAMKLGAYDFVLKPFKLDDVRRVVQRGLEHQAVQAENLRLREALTLYEVSEAIAASLSLDQVLDTVAKACFRDLGADAVWTWLEDSTGVWFERQALGRDSAHPPGRLHASEVVARMQGGAALRSDASAVLLEQGSSTESFFSEAPGLRPSSFVAAHLRSNNRVVGFMALAIFEDPPAPTPTLEGRRFTEGQRKLLSILSARAAAAIENARLFESLERSFQQTIEGLASAIDKMDRYTAGHSERVADYAVLIANKLGTLR
jgi:CheY-like chemotaxis protein